MGARATDTRLPGRSHAGDSADIRYTSLPCSRTSMLRSKATYSAANHPCGVVTSSTIRSLKGAVPASHPAPLPVVWASSA